MIKNRGGISFAVVCLVSMLWSCTSRNPDFQDKDFPLGELVRIDTVPDFQDVLGAPAKITYCGSGKILLAETEKDKLLTMLDLHSGSYAELLNMGNGPKEALVAWDIQKKDDEYFIFDIMRQRLLFVNTDSIAIGKVIDMPVESYQYLRICGTRSGYAALPSMGENKRLMVLDNTFAVIKENGFPDGYKSDGIPPSNDMFQALIGYSSVRDRIITVCFDSPYIDIYDGSGSLVRHLEGPFVSRSTFRRRTRGEAMDIVQEHAIYCFSSLSVGGDRFMVGYGGENESDGQNQISILYMFDIEGNPLVRFVCPEQLSMFDVDWERNIVYGVSSDKEAKIVAYSF